MLQDGRRVSLGSAGSGLAVAPPGDTDIPAPSPEESDFKRCYKGLERRSSGTTATVDTASELNVLVQGYIAACKGEEVVAIPEEFKSKRVIIRIAVKCNKWVTLICLVCAVAFGLGSAKEGGVDSVKGLLLLMQQGNATSLELRIALAVFVIFGLVLVGLEIADTILGVMERRTRNHQLTQLREHVQSVYNARQNIDAKVAYVFERLIAVYDEVFTNVHGLKAGVHEGARTYQTVKQQHADLLARVTELRGFVTEQVEKIGAAERGCAAMVEENTRLVRARLESVEEKVEKTFVENCTCVTESLERAQENSRRTVSELRNLLKTFEESISTLLAKGSEATKSSMEKTLQAHQHWMSTTSKIFSVEGAASISMCVFFLKAYSHIKDVRDAKDLQEPEGNVGRFPKLFINSAGKMINKLLRKQGPRTKVAAISSILRQELAPIVDLKKELEEALETGTNVEHYDAICRVVVQKCYESLFSVERGMFKTVEEYQSFLKNLYTAREDDDISDLEGEYVTLNQLRDCTPFLMVMQLILRIVMNVQSMHDLADRIHTITGQPDIDLERIFRGTWVSDDEAAGLAGPQTEIVPTRSEAVLEGDSMSRTS